MSRSRFIFECPQPGCKKRYTRLEYVKRHAQFQHHRNFLNQQIAREIAKDPEEHNVTFTETGDSEPTKALKLTWPGTEVIEPNLEPNLAPNLAPGLAPNLAHAPVQSAQSGQNTIPAGQMQYVQPIRGMSTQETVGDRTPSEIRSERMYDLQSAILTQSRVLSVHQYENHSHNRAPREHSQQSAHQIAQQKNKPVSSRHRSQSQSGHNQSHNRISQPVQPAQPVQHAHLPEQDTPLQASRNQTIQWAQLPVQSHLPVQLAPNQAVQTANGQSAQRQHPQISRKQPVQFLRPQLAQTVQHHYTNSKSEVHNATQAPYTKLTQAVEPAGLVQEVYTQQRQEIGRLNGEIRQLHQVLAEISQLLADQVRTR